MMSLSNWFNVLVIEAFLRILSQQLRCLFLDQKKLNSLQNEKDLLKVIMQMNCSSTWGE